MHSLKKEGKDKRVLSWKRSIGFMSRHKWSKWKKRRKPKFFLAWLSMRFIWLKCLS